MHTWEPNGCYSGTPRSGKKKCAQQRFVCPIWNREGCFFGVHDIFSLWTCVLFLWCRRDFDFLSPLYQKELLKERFPQILMPYRVVQLGQISLGWGSQGQRGLILRERVRAGREERIHTVHTHLLQNTNTQVSLESSRNRSQSLELTTSATLDRWAKKTLWLSESVLIVFIPFPDLQIRAF